MGQFEDICYSKHGFPDKGELVGGRPSAGRGRVAGQATPAPAAYAVMGEARSQPSSADSGRSGPLGGLSDT
ncbi:hypothetical protein LIER_17234 [Lithospermum erythrorhizon]|uniref:Uncharacterized protein n=1 Tax=Lithospermum erythrorhizon TaxID=34254 RepID=A0AAV3QBR2_LITER